MRIIIKAFSKILVSIKNDVDCYNPREIMRIILNNEKGSLDFKVGLSVSILS